MERQRVVFPSASISIHRIKMFQTKVVYLQEVSTFDSGSLPGTKSYVE
jgi:hypothetical protein